MDTMLIEKARRRDKRSQTTELKVNIDPLKSLQSINSYSATLKHEAIFSSPEPKAPR